MIMQQKIDTYGNWAEYNFTFFLSRAGYKAN